ncbi:MAG: cytochrome b/b6 domain-containing protein [bacterium]
MIQYVKIWSGVMRLCHWGMAVGLVFLMFSSFYMNVEGMDSDFWRDWHLMVGQIFSLILALRIVLFFIDKTGSWKNFIPTRAKLRAIPEMFRFYLSFGQFSLPSWYAYNPLWLFAYAIIYVLMLSAVISGYLLMMAENWNEASVFNVHQLAAPALIWLSLAHVIAVIMHDWKSKAAFISAMFSGYRYFETEGKQIMANKEGKDSIIPVVVTNSKDTN